MAYATIEQYDARFPNRTVSDATLQACLNDASEAIEVELDSAGIDYSEPTEKFAARLASVCCSVASRILPTASDIPQGATNVSMTAGPYSQSFEMPTAYSAAALNKYERKLLGIGGKLGFARPSYGILEVDDARL